METEYGEFYEDNLQVALPSVEILSQAEKESVQ